MRLVNPPHLRTLRTGNAESECSPFPSTVHQADRFTISGDASRCQSNNDATPRISRYHAWTNIRDEPATFSYGYWFPVGTILGYSVRITRGRFRKHPLIEGRNYAANYLPLFVYHLGCERAMATMGFGLVIIMQFYHLIPLLTIPIFLNGQTLRGQHLRQPLRHKGR